MNTNKIVSSIWSFIESTFEDIDETTGSILIYLDGYVKNEEEGKVLATINSVTKEVIYKDERAKTDEYAQTIIKEVLAEL